MVITTDVSIFYVKGLVFFQTFGRSLLNVDHTKVYRVYTFMSKPDLWQITNKSWSHKGVSSVHLPEEHQTFYVEYSLSFLQLICGCITLISSQRLCEHYYFAWTNKLTTFLFENMHYISVEYILIDDLLTLKWLHASLNIIRRKHIHISTFLRETIQVTQLITKQIHF